MKAFQAQKRMPTFSGVTMRKGILEASEKTSIFTNLTCADMMPQQTEKVK